MRPTIGKLDVGTDTFRCDQAIISGVSIDLKDACEPLQYPLGMEPAATWCIGKGYPWRRTATPRSIITGQGPEVSGLGLAGARIENWRTSLVHEQLRRPLQVGDESVEDRAKFECCPADPVGKSGSIKVDALSAHDLSLPIKRQVIGVFGDQHMRYGRLGRQSGVDQS